MSCMRAFRLALAVVIAVLVLAAVPAYSSQGTAMITALAIDPQNPTTLYAGTTDRGVFKSTDGGATWSGSTTGLTSIAVGALVIDAQTPTALYAGTTDRGVYKSTDAGASWGATGLTNGSVQVLAVDPQTPTTLYALIPDVGVFKSTDGGATWSATGLMTGGVYCGSCIIPVLTVTALAIDPLTPSTLYAGVYYLTSEWA